ncbi:hypothetical protein N7476_000753 [Penicillium atrosanguineum]|uniref:RNase MRP protein 1 RNA binding domain-containing protein n=1 Tax=Penicillium atrosanguineum TaxID=1132637 RepID=A0A9W9QCN5_9EURO|nr:hypothetical protein N7476_000753 [Penicillium atrosanguineum]
MDTKEILAVYSILHLVYHRNKNQHQRAKWWKWLSALKRITLDLGSTDSAKAAACRQHLASHLSPRCYMYVMFLGLAILRLQAALAFSTVIADNQFATLGVVLLAALARLTKATGTEREMATRMQPTTKRDTPVVLAKEDRGERISRDGSDALSGPTKAPASKAVAKLTDDTSSARRTKNPARGRKMP